MTDNRQAKRDDGSPLVPFFPAGWGEYEEDFNREINGQSPRATALILAAFLEWRVKQGIRSRLFVADKQIDAIIGTDDKPGELGFLHNCRLAYSLGLIGEVGLKDLERIAKIRNKFAHHLDVVSFDDRRIKGLCQALETPWRAYEVWGRIKSTDPSDLGSRALYAWTCQMVSAMIWRTSVRIVVNWPQMPDNHLLFW